MEQIEQTVRGERTLDGAYRVVHTEPLVERILTIAALWLMALAMIATIGVFVLSLALEVSRG